MAMRACILVKVGPGKHNAAAKVISKMKGVKFAFPVLGRFDVAADIETKDYGEIIKLLTRINDVQGVYATETLLEMEV